MFSNLLLEASPTKLDKFSILWNDSLITLGKND